MRGRAAFFVSLRGITDPGEVVIDAIMRSRFKDSIGGERMLRSSAGALYLEETIEILRDASPQLGLGEAVLLFDDFDESPYPSRMAAAMRHLSSGLKNWKIVVASRSVEELRRFEHFSVIRLRPISMEDAVEALRMQAAELPEQVIRRAAELAGGNPLLLFLLGQQLRDSGGIVTSPDAAEISLSQLVNDAIESSPESAGILLEEMALAGG